MCFTKGQWLESTTTRSAGASAKSERLTVRPVAGSGSEKPGATVPSASIVEGTMTMVGYRHVQ